MSAESLHPIFSHLKMKLLGSTDFDENILTNDNELKVVFFWGHDCPNCEVAKRSLKNELAAVESRGLRWYHVNVYNDFDLGTRFGLHGIPCFLFFRGGKKLGRISPFPGIDPFLEAVDGLIAKG